MRWLPAVSMTLAASVCQAGFNLVPSDAVHLSPEELPPFLQIICPGHAQTAGCDVCPTGTFFRTGRWDLRSVIFGHFVSPASEDVILGGWNCESHANGNGGSFLLTRSDAHWRLVNYAAGRIVEDCKKLKGSDGRDRLVCMGSDQHIGIGDSFLYVLDPALFDRQEGLNIFFRVSDSLGSCSTLVRDGLSAVESGEIEHVVFAKTLDTGVITIIVDARLSRAFLPHASLEDCNIHLKPGEERLRPGIRTELRRFQFLFDGKAMRAAASNPRMHRAEAIPPETLPIFPN
jgi:hypothetical protein